MELTPENLEACIIEFYRNPDKVNVEVHEWLKRCQDSREAFYIVWPLLEPTKILQVQFIAANILYHKITRSIREVPEYELVGLKEKLIAAVARYINGPSIVLTRLGLTLGAFVGFTIGKIWPTPLEDLGSTFTPANFPGVEEHKVHELLIQIFGLIPEQTHSHWQHWHSKDKKENYRAIQEKGNHMLGWLYNVVKAKSNKEMTMQSLKAMMSWMKMVDMSDWSEIQPFVETLVNYCQTSASNEHEDEFCELTLEFLSGIIADPTIHTKPNLILFILDKIIPLYSCVDGILQRQDMELASSFYSMFVTLGDNHSRIVVETCDIEHPYNKSNPNNRTNVLKLIDILLKCTATPGIFPLDEIISNFTISVWYSFVEDIQQKLDDSLTYVRIMEVFEWVYKALAEILVKKSQYPICDDDWNKEEKEQFRIYRQDVSDCLTYCFELRGWFVLNELCAMAEVILKRFEMDPSQIDSTWPELESILMGIRSVSENISDESDPLLMEPMSKAFNIIYRSLKINQAKKIPQLFQGAIECISTCSGLIQSFDSVAKNVIGFILEGLFDPKISSSASLALKTLSRDSSRNLSEFAPQILNSCKVALNSGTLTEIDSIRLVYCIGKFLPYLPNDQIIVAVNEIFSPALNHLQLIASTGSGDVARPEMKPDLIKILRTLSTLCLSLDTSSKDSDSDDDQKSNENIESFKSNTDAHLTQQPLIPVVESILPFLIPLANTWSRDEEVMEDLFDILKHTLSTIHSSSPLVLQYSIELILISFRINPVTAATALAKQTILMIGKENVDMQTKFLHEIHPFALLHMKNPHEKIDFTEAYFNFIGQLLKNNKNLVVNSGIDIYSLYSIAFNCLNFAETVLVRSSISFIAALIDKSQDIKNFHNEFINSQGQALVQKVLLGIGFVVPRSLVQYFAEILLVLNKMFTSYWRKWLGDSLSLEGFPTPHSTQDCKNQFFMKVTRERVNKRVIQEAIEEFALHCRNIAGTQYAFETSKRF